MGRPCMGSCNSNTCMKQSFEGRQMSMLLRTISKFCDLPGGGGGRTVRPNNSRSENEERPMDFELSSKQKEWLDRVQSFMTKHVRPAVPIYKKQDEEGSRWKVIPIL